ncbi:MULTISPECIES: AraC family transcriptional regulator [Psychrilyobacter]|uniref:Helix-turn-helix domain-containing protein n=1 Tax=Psychrilyobacter piezotolerans TaxID=2293438 RepID=A0ABX9KJJ4_9FUSO|nr:MULTISPECIES: AraC family transcriptional regulator [Psychrilyobacter]MCS5421074.1 AraC family transcriptional regulator [Psychrilyobacter sp. S5]NDI76767.1 helix-turn-helix transcriptional regulator [Psychrilyobacter piezotolerans]RDE65051.1 AraC family transcriptional regulator [Psychrilyobacter sp. S5]REI42621.1 helix-turn-helix domain-containing protein [Psychrilyobacter piezotolerans]
MNYTPILKEIIDYVENNIYRPITLDEIAANFFISKFHFHRIFKVYTGISFGQYMGKRRLQHIGDDILKDRSAEIWKVALKYSYTQPQILNRTFKKYYNITPTQYRKDNIRTIIQDKLVILEKETISLNGKIMIDLSLDYLEKTKVYGVTYSIDLTKTPLTEEEIVGFTKMKSQDFIGIPQLRKMYYVSIKRTKDIYTFGFFTDKKLDFSEHFTIPSGLYALLHYSGDRLYNSLDVVINDIQSIFDKEHLTPNRDILEVVQQFFIENPAHYSIIIPVEVSK